MKKMTEQERRGEREGEKRGLEKGVILGIVQSKFGSSKAKQ
jgi:hypothetical protein